MSPSRQQSVDFSSSTKWFAVPGRVCILCSDVSAMQGQHIGTVRIKTMNP